MSVWLDNLDAQFVRCRKLGHQWDELGWQRLSDRSDGVALRCLRCASERFDAYDAVGWKVGRRYRYADGYGKPRGEDRPDFSDLTRALRANGKHPKSMRSPVLEDMARRLVE